jgi:hypothetical protein
MIGVWKPLNFSVCAQIENYKYMKPNIAVGKTVYKWKIADTRNPVIKTHYIASGQCVWN